MVNNKEIDMKKVIKKLYAILEKLEESTRIMDIKLDNTNDKLDIILNK